MATKFDARQSVLRSALGMVGSAINDGIDTIFPKIDAEIAKMYEDRNILLTDGGLITFSGTQILFTEALKITLNQKISGAAPQVISLGSTTVTVANGSIFYAVVNRTAGTATLATATTLPAATSANQEVFFIAKRVDAGDGTMRVYWRNGMAMDAGQSVRLGASGSGSGGGINYIGNSGAEVNVTGWAAYADAAGALPVDGTGGSPVVTITRTTSSPLRGAGSFLITKDGNNRQGQGASYSFTIDNADKASMLSVSFDYETVSGAGFTPGNDSITGDLNVYLYDVTNATIIQPSPYKIISNSGHFKATFQTSLTSNSYRLIFHIPSTSALSWTFKLDNISVSPQIILQGPPVTDWVNAGPVAITAVTTNPTKGTIVRDNMYWRRIGDSMEVVVEFEQSSAGTAGVGAYLFALPGGYSIDSSKATLSTNAKNAIGFGQVSTTTTGVGNLNPPVTLFTFDATHVEAVFYSVNGGTEAAASVSNLNYHLGQTIVQYKFSFRVPILGWSSSVSMSNDTDTRVVTARYSTTATNPAGAPITTGWSQKFDTHGAFDTSTGQYKVPVPGYYRVSALFSASGSYGAGQGLRVELFKNGAIDCRIDRTVTDAAVSNTLSANGSTIVKCDADDLLDLRITITGGSLDGSPDDNYFTIERLTGPAAIAASEKMSSRYLNTAGQSIAAGATPILVFGVKSYDSHGNYNTSTGVWTAQDSRTIKVNVKFNWTNNQSFTATQGAALYIFKNGAVYAQLDGYSAQTSGVQFIVPMRGSDDVKVVAGDTIDIRVNHGEATARTIASGAGANYVTFSSV